MTNIERYVLAILGYQNYRLSCRVCQTNLIEYVWVSSCAVGDDCASGRYGIPNVPRDGVGCEEIIAPCDTETEFGCAIQNMVVIHWPELFREGHYHEQVE